MSDNPASVYRWSVCYTKKGYKPVQVEATNEVKAIREACRIWGEKDWVEACVSGGAVKLGKVKPPKPLTL